MTEKPSFSPVWQSWRIFHDARQYQRFKPQPKQTTTTAELLPELLPAEPQREIFCIMMLSGFWKMKPKEKDTKVSKYVIVKNFFIKASK